MRFFEKFVVAHILGHPVQIYQLETNKIKWNYRGIYRIIHRFMQSIKQPEIRRFN